MSWHQCCLARHSSCLIHARRLILSLKTLMKHHRITYNSNPEDVFNVHIGNGQVIQFRANDKGLYMSFDCLLSFVPHRKVLEPVLEKCEIIFSKYILKCVLNRESIIFRYKMGFSGYFTSKLHKARYAYLSHIYPFIQLISLV